MDTQTEKNQLVKIVEWIINTLALTLVSLFDGVRAAADHASPSLFALIAVLLPFALPLPVAFMTAQSAQTFFDWKPWAANVLGFGLEGLGLLAWVKLVDSVLDYVKSNNNKVTSIVILYAVVSLVYETLLIFINVVLARREGADDTFTVVLICICLLPALSATLYGHQKQTAEYRLAQERAAADALAEKIRQEKRQDRKEAQALKLRQQYAADTDALQLGGQPDQGAKFRRKK